MKRQLDEVAAIADDPAAPTFENTLVALEKSGQLLERVSLVFNGLHVRQHEPRPADRSSRTVAPKLAAHEDAIFLNAKLFSAGRGDLRPSATR
ncbi:MAG: hypothetical protein MZV63_18215 [Marinilabiliales bacterium]|nr:hypothetical protein [Marinilabiliales bacterium]